MHGAQESPGSSGLKCCRAAAVRHKPPSVVSRGPGSKTRRQRCLYPRNRAHGGKRRVPSEGNWRRWVGAVRSETGTGRRSESSRKSCLLCPFFHSQSQNNSSPQATGERGTGISKPQWEQGSRGWDEPIPRAPSGRGWVKEGVEALSALAVLSEFCVTSPGCRWR